MRLPNAKVNRSSPENTNLANVKLTGECRAYWDRYLSQCAPSERPRIEDVDAAPAGDERNADELLALYLSGKKTAGSGLVKDYKMAGDPLPSVGRFWIILDWAGNPRCIVKTIKVEIHRFDEVPSYIARAEGEGDGSLEYWRDEHARFFEKYLDELDITDLNSEPVVTEFFELVFSS